MLKMSGQLISDSMITGVAESHGGYNISTVHHKRNERGQVVSLYQMRLSKQYWMHSKVVPVSGIQQSRLEYQLRQPENQERTIIRIRWEICEIIFYIDGKESEISNDVEESS